MTELRVVPAAEADPEALDGFLRRSFGEAKAEFLRRHGAWWHRGEENRWVLLEGDVIAGYCGVIPTRCIAGGTAKRALWKMDLVIAPEYRGRGLQRLLDREVRKKGRLLLGFPNARSAQIHRRNGWRIREDLQTLLLPLRPTEIRALGRSRGRWKFLYRSAAGLLAPIAAVWRRRLVAFRPRSARRLDPPDFEVLARVATECMDPRWVTTARDASFLRWRYGEAPHRCFIYGVGEGSLPRLILVSRRVIRGKEVSERWLDLYGDLGNRPLLDELIRLAAGDAVRRGSAQVTVLVSHQGLRSALRRAGFLFGSTSRFCWLDDDRETMEAIASTPHHWCLGDSDNDEPAVEEATAVADPERVERELAEP